MSIFGKQLRIGLLYLGGFAILGILLYQIAPFWTVQLLGVLWFAVFVWRLMTLRCPNCGKVPTSGPLTYNPFKPTCLNCGISWFARVPAA